MNQINCVAGHKSTHLATMIILLFTFGFLPALVQAKSPGYYFQQDKTIRGKITDEQGNGLPGVTVQQKGTTNGTTTSATGDFSLTVPANAVLDVSYVGYIKQQVQVSNRADFAIKLQVESSEMNNVVVIGYGSA